MKGTRGTKSTIVESGKQMERRENIIYRVVVKSDHRIGRTRQKYESIVKAFNNEMGYLSELPLSMENTSFSVS